MMNRGTNSTRLGTYSPQYGVYIYPQFSDSVVIEGDVAERSSQVHLVESDVDERDSEVCCVFNVFPSGVLETCTVTTTTGTATDSIPIPMNGCWTSLFPI